MTWKRVTILCAGVALTGIGAGFGEDRATSAGLSIVGAWFVAWIRNRNGGGGSNPPAENDKVGPEDPTVKEKKSFLGWFGSLNPHIVGKPDTFRQ